MTSPISSEDNHDNLSILSDPLIFHIPSQFQNYLPVHSKNSPQSLSSSLNTNPQNSGIHNMSNSFIPSEDMISLLQKGLKFIPSINSIPDQVILENFSEFHRKFQTKFSMSKVDNVPYNKLLHYPSKFMPKDTSKDIYTVGYNVRDLLVQKSEELNILIHK